MLYPWAHLGVVTNKRWQQLLKVPGQGFFGYLNWWSGQKTSFLIICSFSSFRSELYHSKCTSRKQTNNILQWWILWTLWILKGRSHAEIMLVWFSAWSTHYRLCYPPGKTWIYIICEHSQVTRYCLTSYVVPRLNEVGEGDIDVHFVRLSTCLAWISISFSGLSPPVGHLAITNTTQAQPSSKARVTYLDICIFLRLFHSFCILDIVL